MNISDFFNSYMGMYVAQAFFHSLIAALIVDRAVRIWEISDPLVRQRFSLIVIVFPVLSFPLYQAINPERGSVSFRLETLFDMGRWLNLELWGRIPLNLLFVIMLSVTTLVFLLQEMIPVIKHTFESRKTSSDRDEEIDHHPLIKDALKIFPGEKPAVSVIDDEEFAVFSTTGKKPVIFLTTGLIRALNIEELQAAVAHEIAHIDRNRRPLMIVAFLIRVLMFFNPVVLVEFRRIIQEEEKICDDIAISMTQKPRALIEVLKRFNCGAGDVDLDKLRKLSTLSVALEDYSHNVHIESRITRLEKEPARSAGSERLRFLITLAVIAVLNYFVV